MSKNDKTPESSPKAEETKKPNENKANEENKKAGTGIEKTVIPKALEEKTKQKDDVNKARLDEIATQKGKTPENTEPSNKFYPGQKKTTVSGITVVQPAGKEMERKEVLKVLSQHTGETEEKAMADFFKSSDFNFVILAETNNQVIINDYGFKE